MSHFVVNETIDRDLGLLGLIRYRKQHGQGCLQLVAIVGGHFGSKVAFCCNWQNEAGLRAIKWANLGCLRAIGGNLYARNTDGVNLDMEKFWTAILDQSCSLLGGDFCKYLWLQNTGKFALERQLWKISDSALRRSLQWTVYAPLLNVCVSWVWVWVNE